jgi:hypothetical protein
LLCIKVSYAFFTKEGSPDLVQIKEDYEGICRLFSSQGGAADGAIEVGGGACAPVVIFDEDKCGFTVFGIPQIFDSVVLTGLSFDAGLLGLHIASFCSGVNDDEDDGVLLLT